MSTIDRSSARAKGLKLAAKVATVGGFAVAALGFVEARAAHAAPARSAIAADVATSAARDDARPMPMEDWMKTAQGGGGNCGCSPCWGPPAPPAMSRARTRVRTRRARRSRRGVR